MPQKATVFLLLFCLGCAVPSSAETLNGFVIDKPLVAAKDILKGGPLRDGIPSIDQPKFLQPSQAKYLNDSDLVMGLAHNQKAKAYPIRILNWHEIVNDTIGGVPVVISYCPLCGTGMVFHRVATTFGVSGLLYQSDMLLYDRKTNSLWSQILMKAVAGPRKGEALKLFPSEMMTWSRWKQKHPKTLVLSTNTGSARDYAHTPYGDYDRNAHLYYPVNKEDKRFHPKTVTLALINGDDVKLYPETILKKAKQPITDTFSGSTVQITYNSEGSSFEVNTIKGPTVSYIRGFWFALATFYPKAKVYGQ